MEKLSSALLTKIQNRPLQTNLRSDSQEIDILNKIHSVRLTIDKNLPIEFDGRIIWKSYLSPIQNQGKCGSCWAWASTTALADRISLRTNNKLHPILSPLKPLICSLDGKEWSIKYPEFASYNLKLSEILSLNVGKAGCHGDTLISAWKYLYTIGTNVTTCLSYKNNKDNFDIIDYSNDSELPLCTNLTGSEGDMCGNYVSELETGAEDGKPARFFRALCYYTILGVAPSGNDLFIMTEIFNNGPVTSGIEVFSNFYTFDPKTEIYSQGNNDIRVGGHAIRIVGWGEEKGIKFWWIANSWGSNWGINGYFRMLRGQNDCKIEENVVCGLPDLFYPTTMIFPLHEQKLIESMPNSIRKERLDLDFGNNLNGGGLDPRTGFTRRAQYRYTGFDFSPLLSLNELIKLNTTPFNAGNLGIKEYYRHPNKVLDQTIIIFILIFCFISLVSFGFICYNAVKVNVRLKKTKIKGKKIDA